MTYNLLCVIVLVVGTKGKSYAAALLTERTGREVPDLLRELYVDRRYSMREVAEATGFHQSTIAAWLRQYGINRADREPATLR